MSLIVVRDLVNEENGHKHQHCAENHREETELFLAAYVRCHMTG